MKRISFTENQFLIVVGMSESEITDIEYNPYENQLYITLNSVNILFDYTRLDIFNPDIKYDEWLNYKYFHPEFSPNNFHHILYDETVKFIIDSPTIFYDGNQDIFIDRLSDLGIESTEVNLYKYVFGGTIEDSLYDEFEVYSNSPIKFEYDNRHLQSCAMGGKSEIQKIALLEEKLARKKESLKKTNKIKKTNSKNEDYLAIYDHV
ncbi:hypothetical protein AEA09_14770 [Lysinibacillus contaminans]|uniref:Uncharacterized protein n=1 Tax=Lysinibacillus contaminans TaxID=1293441 RepID=A0ABR5JXU1_9BACI|nr:hypothetical protein [Lysinibacillus contaminans]KOS67113.1 hypothetical protein AEA09_14770 [Lysinibacillus contaminans]